MNISNEIEESRMKSILGSYWLIKRVIACRYICAVLISGLSYHTPTHRMQLKAALSVREHPSLWRD